MAMESTSLIKVPLMVIENNSRKDNNDFAENYHPASLVSG